MRTDCASASSRVSTAHRPLLSAILLLALAAPVAAQDTDAQCMLQFDAAWSAKTHPIDFPANAHFSPLIGGNHDDQTVFWQSGELATPGIQSMAETGATTLLTGEVNDAINAGGAESVITGPGIPLSPSSAQTSFDVSLDYPRITVVTMIAPSPDWFVGVNGLNLFENGSWRQTTIVDLLPYDAGTDSGATFNSANAPTVPPEPIARINQNPLPGDVPLGTFSIVCDSPLLFQDGFESGNTTIWSSAR